MREVRLADDFVGIIRPERYRRKRDDAIVTVIDWPNGDVSWRLENFPLVYFGRIVGTCSARTFARNHERIAT